MSDGENIGHVTILGKYKFMPYTKANSGYMIAMYPTPMPQTTHWAAIPRHSVI